MVGSGIWNLFNFGGEQIRLSTYDGRRPTPPRGRPGTGHHGRHGGHRRQSQTSKMEEISRRSATRVRCCFAIFIIGRHIRVNDLFCHAFTQSHHRHRQPSLRPILSQCKTPCAKGGSCFYSSSTALHAKPKRGSTVDSYQTVSVNCNSCKTRLFRYKKKNGTKSNLIKCYVERIVIGSDPEDVLERQLDNFTELSKSDHKWTCPNCGANFGRCSLIHGLPAIKLVGGKTRMTKK